MRLLLLSLISLLGLPSVFGVELVGALSIKASATNAVIHWVTDVPAGTRVQVSPAAHILPSADSSPGTDHTATLADLRPGVKYTVVVGTARVRLTTNEFTTSGATTASTTATAKRTLANKNSTKPSPATQDIWGNLTSLADHFERHGSDFNAKNPDDYARKAWEFLQRAKTDGWPAKVDDEGVLRIFDPRSGTFAAYNKDGTAKTFFKPGSRDYFDRQPGHTVNLKTWK